MQISRFSAGGFVIHRIKITDKTFTSAWYDLNGNLLDSPEFDYVIKAMEAYVEAR